MCPLSAVAWVEATNCPTCSHIFRNRLVVRRPSLRRYAMNWSGLPIFSFQEEGGTAVRTYCFRVSTGPHITWLIHFNRLFLIVLDVVRFCPHIMKSQLLICCDRLMIQVALRHFSLGHLVAVLSLPLKTRSHSMCWEYGACVYQVYSEFCFEQNSEYTWTKLYKTGWELKNFYKVTKKIWKLHC